MFTSKKPASFSVLSSALATLFLGACTSEKKVMLQSSAVAPAAQGSLRYKKQDGQNTHLKLKVSHLAHPEKISSGASTYVVWVLPTNGNPPQNVGTLDVGKELKGELETATPYKSMSIFITPEKVATATAPSGERVLTSTVLE